MIPRRLGSGPTWLDAGADDYLTKPFGSRELLARLRVALRRTTAATGEDQPVFALRDLDVDLAHRRVKVRGEEISLTRTEYRLLQLLVAHAGRVLTHGQILREAWGPTAIEHVHYVRVHMANLRRKLELDPAQPEYIVTELGVGYRLESE